MIALKLTLSLLQAVCALPSGKRQVNDPLSTAPSGSPVAKVTLGGPNQPIEVTGTVNAALNLDQYFNIPFAKPPVGQMRFASPEPAEYTGPINATAYGPACLQATPDYASDFGDLVGPYGQSEDCLQLNVFVPRDVITIGTGFPVLVFVHGGGFFGGSANTVDGSLLVSAAAKKNKSFIFVTVQYRVGVLGFPLSNDFAEQGLTNLGLRDVKLALEWVQTNINSFRGDPTKVTIAGQSAGAALAGLTHLWPDHDLYRSSIMMSGTPSLTVRNSTGLMDLAASPAWDVMLDSIGCGDGADVVTCLRNADSELLLEAQNNLSAILSPYALYGPTVDGNFVPASPYTLLAEGAVRPVPFLIGNTKDEGTAFAPRDDISDERFRAYVGNQQLPPASNETIDRILELYPNDPELGAPFDTGNETFGLSAEWKRAAAFATDRLFTAPRRHFASSMTNNGNKGWSYRWDEAGVPGVPAELGAFHGSDIFFLSGLPFVPGANYTEAQQSLAGAFISYIANFVHFADPNGPATMMNSTDQASDDDDSQGGTGPILWPSYDNGTILTISSTEIAQVPDNYRKEQIDFLNTNQEIVNGF